MSDLASRRCVACRAGMPRLDAEGARTLLPDVPGWSTVDDGKAIARTFTFENYYQTLAFVNAAAWIAHTEDHHPELEVHWGKCVVKYWTHAVDGLTENDFICAAKVNALLPTSP